jgi:hypothetical protein
MWLNQNLLGSSAKQFLYCKIGIKVFGTKRFVFKNKVLTSVWNSKSKTNYLTYEVPNTCEMVGEIHKMQLKINPNEFANFIIHFLLITNLTHFFNVFIYFTSLHVSCNPVLIVRRINCINTYSHPHRVTYTRWCSDTADSPDDEHWFARNM